MPKLPNSLRGPGGETRPSGKDERYHGLGLLFFILSFVVAYALSVLLSWVYLSGLLKGPDPWGWGSVTVFFACIWSMMVFPVLAVLLILITRKIPGIGKTLTGHVIALVITAMLTPFATHAVYYMIARVSGS